MVQCNEGEQYFYHKMYGKFQNTAREILNKLAFASFPTNYRKQTDKLASGITNALIFELLYFGNLSISLASSRLLPFLSLSLCHSLSLSLYRKAGIKSPSTFR